VGVGPQGGSCHKCEYCDSSREQYCKKYVNTYGQKTKTGTTQGGYAMHHRTEAAFAIPIPDSMPSETVAPLLCAGITTYHPLKAAKVGPGMRVGVIGIGL
jgi:D-arabinose 1-dehydrogenase-like Zn-dependent alcohol dehydrogenase